MGKSLSQTLGVKDPLDDAIHGWIKPGPQQNNFQAPPWWGPNKPTGIPGGGAGYQTHAALPTTPLAGLPAYVPPAGAPAPPGGPPPSVASQMGPGGRPLPMAPPPAAAAPAAAPPAALAQGLAALPGARTFVNGKPVTTAVEQQAAFGGMPHG